MCGIAGYSAGFGNGNFIFQIGHRGPDGHGVYYGNTFTLLHTRLSIIDLSENGKQPLFNEERSLAIVCNGEIFNYKTLNERLIREGHVFSSGSDSETILHLFESEGRNMHKVLEQLIGMFAFSILDLKTDELWVVRDRLGIKPLYFHHNQEKFAFCSEVEPLVKSGLVECTIDESSVYEYFLLGSVPGPNTWYKEVKSLEPGHFLHWKNNELQISKYWGLAFATNLVRTEAEWIQKTAELFGQIVKEHLVADVPVGCFLSAGIDSSLVSFHSVQADARLTAFTAGFSGKSVDESLESMNIAKILGVNHKIFDIKEDFFTGIQNHFEFMDQPFGIASGLNLSRISQLAGNSVKVVLSGDGGDELFAGYDRHLPFYEPEKLKYIPKALRRKVIGFLARMTKKKSIQELKCYLNKPDYLKYLDRVKVLPESEALDWVHPDFRKMVDLNRYNNMVKDYWGELKNADLTHKMLYVDLKTSLVDEMMTKTDRFTLHRGLEGRVPFLDHRFVEFAFTMPTSYKIRQGHGKWILRKLVEKHYGTEIAFRNKTGFSSPIKDLMKQDIYTQTSIEAALENLQKAPFLNQDLLKTLGINKAYSDRHPETIFGLLALDVFINHKLQVTLE